MQFCAQCGTRFTPIPPEPSPFVCESCEIPLPGGSRFCPGCGQAFDEPVPATAPPNPGFRPQSVPPEPAAATLSQPQPVPVLVQLKMPSFSQAVGPKVNYGWISEAWRLFQQKPDVWVLSTLAQYLPFVLLYGVAALFGILGAGGKVLATRETDPHAYEGANTGLLFGMAVAFIPSFLLACRLNYATFMMANKQVMGGTLTLSDIFKSGRGVWPVFWLGNVWAILFFIGVALFYVPALLFTALTLPCFALAAQGVGALRSLQLSVAGMKNDWLNAIGFSVAFLLLLIASALPCGLGLLITYPMYNLIVSLACRDMIGLPASSEPSLVQSRTTSSPIYAPKPISQAAPVPAHKPSGATSSTQSGILAARGTVISVGGLVVITCLSVGFWLFHVAHPSAPVVVTTSSSVAPVSDSAPNASTSSGEAVFPVHWGPYTVTRADGIDEGGTSSQKARISNAARATLWESDNVQSVSVSECEVTGSDEKEARITAFSGGSGGSGTGYYFSRSNGLHLLFSYDFGDSDDITGFTKYDTNSRPRMQVDHSIVDFDGLAHRQRQVFKCVYTWDGRNYVNATAEFPQDARTAENEAQARYLHHWQENSTADFNGINEDVEGGDSADREDAIGYWANAMAIGDGDTAKNWLLAHANPRLASHLQQIEENLRKEIPQEGAKLDIKMGDGTNLDQPATKGSGISATAGNRTTSDKPILLPQSASSEEHDPLKETAARGSGLTDQLLDSDTLQHRIISGEDLSGRSLSALSISYNAIYAAHGYVFKRSSLQQLFSQAHWYRPNPAFREQDLSEVEKANLKTIREYERTHYGY